MEQPFLYTLQVSDGNILDNSGTAKGEFAGLLCRVLAHPVI